MSDLYEILVSNEDTRDQVVRLLDEKFHHPNITIMASSNGKQVDKYLDKRRKLHVKCTRIYLTDAPKSIDDKMFFKQLAFHLLRNHGGKWMRVPMNFEMHPDQHQIRVSENLTEYTIDEFAALELNMPPLTEIRLQLLTK